MSLLTLAERRALAAILGTLLMLGLLCGGIVAAVTG